MTRHTPKEDTGLPGGLWHDAAAYAQRAHRGQTRRDGVTPYAAHVARVALNVAALFGCYDDKTLAIAWLHDTIEDTTTDYEDLLECFGEVVAQEVAALSKNPALPSDVRDRVYDNGLEAATWRAKIVKLGDVLDNMRDSRDEGNTGKRARVIDMAERVLRIAAADSDGRDELVRASNMVHEALTAYRLGP